MSSEQTSYTDHERSLVDQLWPENQAVLPLLTGPERHSLEKYVDLDNIAKVQDAIGSDEQIESTLFWDQGGKFDDSHWKQLKPVEDASLELFSAALGHYEKLRTLAIEVQRRSDLTLYSQFNPGLLYTGIAGAVRVDVSGKTDPSADFFRGVEMRLIGSVEEKIDSLTILPKENGGFRVHYGAPGNHTASGLNINTSDHFSALQLAQLLKRDLKREGLVVEVLDAQGQMVEVDAKAIRKAARANQSLNLPPQVRLQAYLEAKDIAGALEAADYLALSYYKRFSLEKDVYNIGRKYGNFFLVRNENFFDFLPETPVEKQGLVIFTATGNCRRCRREVEGFRDIARDYPALDFALVNLNAPHSNFHHRVFGDMAGGNPDDFRKNASGATPFVIIYKSDDNGVLKYVEYFGTEKEDKPPTLQKINDMLRRHFGRAAPTKSQ